MPTPLIVAAVAAILFAAPSPQPPGAKQPTAQSLSRAVTRKLANKTMSARFCQHYVDKVTGERPKECGTVWAVPDGRMRFTYDHAGKEFVFDGKAAYFAEPEAGQVTLLEGFAGTPLANALALVWGGKALDGGPFAIARCTADDCPKTKTHEQALRLLPKGEVQGVAYVDVIIDVGASEVVASIVKDPLGNITTYSLSERKIGLPIASNKFVYYVPEGLSVLRAGE